MKRDLMRALVCLATFGTASALAAPGRTPGNASVSSSGAANYTIPLWTPPGIRGLAPNLALVYSSRSGDGLAGVGFTVAFGQSAITRCDRTIVQDGAAQGADLSATDKFCLDGNRLRLTGGTYGAANSTYQTEIEAFSKVIAKGTAGTGPQWFEVWGKNGLIYEYGNTADSRIESNLEAGGQTTTVRAWSINKVRDRTGNAISFKYIDDTTNGSFRPDEITWAGNSIVPISDRYRIKFVYETPDRPDPIYSYLFGNATGVDGHINEFKRLDRIDVYRDTPSLLLLRRYELTFDSGGGISGRSRLQSFRECGGSAGTDCLSQTDFTWQNGTIGVATTPISSGQAIPIGVTPFIMDIDGDGRDDVVWSSSATSGSGTWRYMPASSTGGYGSAVNTSITNTNHGLALPIQWNGDDKWDLLVPYSGNVWHVLIANGSGFNAPSSTGVSSTGGYYWVADIDGDGRGDLIRATNIAGIGKVYVRLRSGSGFSAETLAIDFGTWAGTELQFSVWGTSPLGKIEYNFASTHQHPDFDGDGREDFILSVNRFNSELGTNTRMLYIVLGRNNGLATGDNFGGLTSLYEWRYGDFNGDGKTDIGYGDGSFFYYAFSRGTSLFANTLVVSNGASPRIVMDWDGDGKDDLVSAKSGSSNWWYARSTGWSLNSLVDSATAATGANPFVGDTAGDGLHDLPYRDTGASNTWKVRKHIGLSADFLLTAADGFGVRATFAYQTISKLATEGGCYTRDAAAPSFPVRAFRGDLIVACTLEASNGIGGTYTQSFTFYNANLHLQGRGFVGFGKVRSTDSRNNLIQQSTFSQTFPHTGMPVSMILYQPNGTTKIAQTVNTLQSLSFGSGFDARSFPYVSNSISDAWEVGGPMNGAWTVRKVSGVSAMDPYGNPTSVTLSTTDEDNLSPWYLENFQVQTVTTITNDTANWCLGLPSETTVTSTPPDGTSQSRTVDHGTPDYLSCRHDQEIVEPASSTLKVTSTYGFDSCGNVNSVTVVGKKPDGTNMPSRVTQTSFGAPCILPESITNALGQTSSAVFNSKHGLLTSQTDANGLTVSYVYDNFGRPTSVTRPDGTSTATSYSLCTSGCDSRVKMVAQVDERDTSSAVIRSSKRYFDMLDRQIYSYDQALTGGYTVSTSYFNALGQLVKQYQPVFDGAGWGGYTEYVHDLLNRATRVQLHDYSGVLDRETVVSYEGRKVVTTDPKGNATQRFLDVRGMLRRLTDPSPGGTTNYVFDHFGNLKSVTDAASNVTSAVYNVRGFRTSTVDPDLGTWIYSINSLGELVSQTDAKSQVTTVVYDKLSRPTSRTEAEGTSSWVWGTSATAKNIGKLASLSGPGGYAESYTFDAFGRPSSTTIIADATYSINMGYSSSTGLPDSLTYPVSTSSYRFKTKFEYGFGILKKISDFNVPSTVYWELNALDERGQPIDEQLGNSARIISGFDPLTGLMSYRQTGTTAPYINRQNLSFEWDLNGNLKKRIDLNQSNLTEEFFYDALNRLDYSQLNGVTNLDLTLNAIGNITAKTSATDPAEHVGTYTYHATKKHAVVSTSNGWSFGYDANGNMNSYKGNTIGWYSYNLPSVLNGAGQNSQFWYGPNRNRWKQVASYAGGGETTIYVGGILEKVTAAGGTVYRHYVGAGSAKVVYSRSTTGSEFTKYITADHLNSSTVVMDSAGASLVNLSFASFGARRGSAWSGSPSSGDWTQISNVTRQGYTGHEHLDNINIVHMNGRVFDPALGRFLSPDRIIRDVGASQSWSGFGYVEGRNLSSTDPSGWASRGMTLVLPILKNEPTPSVGQIMNQINQIAGSNAFLALYAHMALGLHASPQVRALQNQVVGPSLGGAGGGTLAGAGAAGSSGGGSGHSVGGEVTSNSSEATMLEQVVVTSTHSRPDLGFTGNLIRLLLDSRFEQFMFERYWLREGPYQLTSAEFNRALREVANESPAASEPVTTDDGRVLTRQLYDFPSGEFDAAFGDASIFFDSTGRAVGFYDFYNMNTQATGDSWWRDFGVERVREACTGRCSPFEITFGDYVRPTGP
jgi:RHS repeat-associated protein